MSDLTVYAEALIATVARAFYDDYAVCVIDVLIRDKFLRDDDMGPRLQIPAKKLRGTLQFLQDEHLVRSETVDDLAQGGSAATKFWYIDYNHAVHTIRLRLHLLRRELQEAEMQARSSSFYLCPGYDTKRCNGRYTEEEAQQVVDQETGLFLCQECLLNYGEDPNGPARDTYTLQLVDNSKDLKLAIDNIRRVNVQLSGKTIGDQQLRAGIYDLLQKTRPHVTAGGGGHSGGVRGGASHHNRMTVEPITSNLPSENFALGRGSKRLAGTGRTVNSKARKLQQQGVAGSANEARNILVGGRDGGAGRSSEGADLTFLKNAMGNEIAFSVERGGGARATLLATRTRRRRKLIDAAATRVGAGVPLDVHVRELERRRALEELEEKARNEEAATGTGGGSAKSAPDSYGKGKNAKKGDGGGGRADNMDWLNNNISREGLDVEMVHLRRIDIADAEYDEDIDADGGNKEGAGGSPILVLEDFEEDALPPPADEDGRKAAFQAMYLKEIARQEALLYLIQEGGHYSSPPKGGGHTAASDGSAQICTPESEITWEDG
jgi:transcription initiation factor IIE alpha subunit